METPGRNPWVVLGLAADSTLADARRAFRSLAKRAHPDAGGDAQAFIEAVDAFGALRPLLPTAGHAARSHADRGHADRGHADRRAAPYDWTSPAPRRTWWDAARSPRPAPPAGPVVNLEFAAVLARELNRLQAPAEAA